MTMSASNASRRASATWQREISGQRIPRQLSRVEVTCAQTGWESDRPRTSARSPRRVVRAQRLMRASMARAARGGDALRHEQLPAAHPEVRQRPLERSAVAENLLEIQHFLGRSVRAPASPATILAPEPWACREAYLSEFPANWCARRRWTRMAGTSLLYQGLGAARDALAGFRSMTNKRGATEWLLPHDN